ncbi:hypothetical protein JVU11DRAFT_12606 [Chiua virens]|nr:hypothetical protein JVU11DRAFT_12606 [Chiua virens]
MPAQPHDQAAALKVAISASSSLVVMIVHWVWLMRGEIKYIWPRLCRSWNARIFVPARYLGLFGQIYNVYFTTRMYLGVPTPPEGCRIWFSFQALVVQVLLVVVEGLLMHRLYALFRCNGAIMMVLVALGGGQLASMGVSVRLSFPTNEYTTTCLLTKANPANAYFSTTMLTVTMILLFMIVWSYCRLPPRFTRQGIGKIVFRDSILSLCALAVLMLFMTFTSLEIIKTSISGNITYYWMVCVLWMSLGSIIVDHEQIPRDDDERGQDNIWRATVQLTSQIEMGESTLTEELSESWRGTHTSSSNTLRSSPSTPTTNVTQLSPSSICTSDSGEPRYFGDHPHLNVRQPIPRRPRIMTRLSLTKTSQPSPSAASTSDSAQRWLEEYLRAHGDGDDQKSSPSLPSPSTALSAEESAPDTVQDEPLDTSVDNGDGVQREESDRLPVLPNVGAQQGLTGPRPSQRLSSSEVRRSEESWSWSDPP